MYILYTVCELNLAKHSSQRSTQSDEFSGAQTSELKQRFSAMRFSTFSLSDEEAARVRENLGHCQPYLKENAYHYKPSLEQSF